MGGPAVTDLSGLEEILGRFLAKRVKINNLFETTYASDKRWQANCRVAVHKDGSSRTYFAEFAHGATPQGALRRLANRIGLDALQVGDVPDNMAITGRTKSADQAPPDNRPDPPRRRSAATLFGK